MHYRQLSRSGAKVSRLCLGTMNFDPEKDRTAIMDRALDTGVNFFDIANVCREESLQALEIRLNADTLKKLDEIWPGPGGPAPEAYAW